jgi:hydrophobe/amphiphile efflux-3 (HAE3) family protein
MRRINLWIVDHPIAATVGVAVLTLFFLFHVPKLVIDTSTEGMMVEKDPRRAYYEGVKKKFGADDLTVVLLKTDDVFTTASLGAIKRLSEAIERIEGVVRVESLTTVNNIKGDRDTLDTEPLVGAAVPSGAEELARIRRDALANPIFVANIVSKDGTAAAVNVYTDPRPGDTEFNARFSARVDGLIREERGRADTGLREAYQIGTPVTKVTFAEYIEADQTNLVPISLAVLLLILYFAFRMLHSVVIPVTTGLLSIVWSLGLMAIFGYPVTVVTAIIPSLLIAIGFTEDVHMLEQYHHHLEAGESKLVALRGMAAESGLPILITTVTTILGFGSLILSDITMLIQFGYASSMALAANFVVTLAVLPAMLRVWPVPRRIRRPVLDDESGRSGMARLMTRVGEFNLRYKVPIAVVTMALCLASLVGLARLKVNTDFVSYFPESSIIRQRTLDLHRSMSGAVTFHVVVETGREDGVKDPSVLRAIAGVQDFLASTGRMDKSVSVADYVKTMHREMNDGDPKFGVVPDSRDVVAQYLLTLEGKDLARYVDHNYSTANIVVRHNVTSSWELSSVLAALDRHVSSSFPKGVTARYTGEAILINNAADYMAVNELTSFSSTFLVIGALHSLLFMSLRAGFLSLVPNVIPILFNYGLMGLLGIPLNTGTALIATIAIGITVDDTVHYMVRYSRELNAHYDQRTAMFNTLRAQGTPIIYVSAALAGGFLVLVFSNFVPTWYLGVLSALVMLVAAVTELVITPILMSSTRLVTLWDMVLVRMKPEVVKRAPLLRDLSMWEARKIVLLGMLRSVGRGEYVIRRGERDTAMFMVVSGRLRVKVTSEGGEKTIRHLEPGDVLGEMALLEEMERSADVMADEPSEVLRLDAASLDRLRKRFPYTSAKLFQNLARILSQRLRDRTRLEVRAGREG